MRLYIPAQECSQQKYASDHSQPHNNGEQGMPACVNQSQQEEGEKDQHQQVEEE